MRAALPFLIPSSRSAIGDRRSAIGDRRSAIRDQMGGCQRAAVVRRHGGHGGHGGSAAGDARAGRAACAVVGSATLGTSDATSFSGT
eukprot:gene8046-4675_t